MRRDGGAEGGGRGEDGRAREEDVLKGDSPLSSLDKWVGRSYTIQVVEMEDEEQA